jgi:hypothetical protein
MEGKEIADLWGWGVSERERGRGTCVELASGELSSAQSEAREGRVARGDMPLAMQ